MDVMRSFGHHEGTGGKFPLVLPHRGGGGGGGGGGEGAAEAIVAGAKAEAMSAPEPFSPAPDPIEVEAEAISTPSSQVAAAGPPTISFFSPAPDPIEVEAEAISTPSSQVAGSGPPVPDQLEDEVESIINYADKGLIPPVTVNVQTCVICPSPLPFVISPSGSP